MHDLVRALSLAAVVACVLAAAGARAQTCPSTCTTNDVVEMRGLMCPTSGAPVDGSVCARLAALEAPPPPTSSSGAVVPSPPPPPVDALACAPGESSLCARLAAVEAALAAAQVATAAAQTSAAAANAALADFQGTTGMVILTTGVCPPGFTQTSQYNERFLAFGQTSTVHGTLTGATLVTNTFRTPLPVSTTDQWEINSVDSNAPPRTTAGSRVSPRIPIKTTDIAPFVYMKACIKSS